MHQSLWHEYKMIRVWPVGKVKTSLETVIQREMLNSVLMYILDAFEYSGRRNVLTLKT